MISDDISVWWIAAIGAVIAVFWMANHSRDPGTLLGAGVVGAMGAMVLGIIVIVAWIILMMVFG